MLLIMDGQRLVNITSLKKFTGLAKWAALPLTSACRTTYTGLIAVKKASVLVSSHSKRNKTVWTAGQLVERRSSESGMLQVRLLAGHQLSWLGMFSGFVKFLLINKCEHRLWLRRLGAGLSPRRPGVDCTSVRVRTVVDILAVGQVRLRVIRVSLSLSFH